MMTLRYIVALCLCWAGLIPMVYAATDCNAVTEIPAMECTSLLTLYDSTAGADWNNPLRTVVVMDADKTCTAHFKPDHILQAEKISTDFLQQATFLGDGRAVTEVYPHADNQARLTEAAYYAAMIVRLLDVQTDSTDLPNTWPVNLNDEPFYRNLLAISDHVDTIQLGAGGEIMPGYVVAGHYLHINVIMQDNSGAEYLQPILVSYEDIEVVTAPLDSDVPDIIHYPITQWRNWRLVE